jgi:hypothetical protein
MAELEVEIDAWVLPHDHTVFKISPGKTYRFMKAVADASIVFPDVRGLDNFDGDPASWDEKKLLNAIVADRTSRMAQTNELEVQQLNNTPTDKATLTFARRIWFEGKKGDIVVVPNVGYTRPVLFGEFLDDPGVIVPVVAKDGEYEGIYYGRRVAWRENIIKRELPSSLIDALQSRAAVFKIVGEAKDEVYRLVYGNYVIDGNYVAEFATQKERFTTQDVAVISTWLHGLDVLRYERDGGELARIGSGFAALGLCSLPEGAASEIQIDIQSPGEIFVRRNSAFPFALMALFALDACGQEVGPEDTVTVRLQSVSGAAAGVESSVSNEVNGLSAALGDLRTEAANLAQRASQEGNVQTNATLTNSPSDGR